MIFSCIIPTKDPNSKKLKHTIKSIRNQDFPPEQIEIIPVSEGDSESAKAIGIRKAQGAICVMLCDDNVLTDTGIFDLVYRLFLAFPNLTGVYSRHYQHVRRDYCLNRYFALTGVNDPVPFYLCKADRLPRDEVGKGLGDFLTFDDKVPSLGDNGFFYRTAHIQKAELDNYYPMDCAEDLRRLGYNQYYRLNRDYIWHRTTDANLLQFLIRRYRYARDLYCDRGDRRWHMVKGRNDIFRLVIYVLCSATFIEPTLRALRGFSRVRDFAWFWHPLVCFSFAVMYGVLTVRTCLKHLLLSRR